MEICDVDVLTGRLVRICTVDDEMAELLRHGAVPADQYHRVIQESPMSVRAKFRVHLALPSTDAAGKITGYRVELSPVYSADPESENAKFYSATPWGQITLGTLNPAAGEQFKPGQEFYVDFTPAV